MAGEALSPEGWAETVRLEEAPELAARLRAGLDDPPPRSLWMTDLLNPRAGYFRRVHPVPPSEERRAVQEVGREAHLRVGGLLAPARYREVRRRRDGLVAQLDLFEDVPTELKTTEIPETGAESVARSSYLDQLGMYCALLDRPEGRLVLVDRRPEAVGRSAVLGVRFDEPGRIWAETLRRADGLRSALDRRDPTGLPRCVWFGRGCEFQAAGVCPCRGDEPRMAPDPLAPTRAVGLSPAATDALRRALAGSNRAGPPTVRRFRDLLYPRRVFFERTVGVRPQEGLPPLEGDGLYTRINDALDELGDDEVVRCPVPGGEPLEAVPCWDGVPYLLKVSRARTPPGRESVVVRQPQYLLELGARCASLGDAEGILIVGYERRPPEAGQLVVYRVRFDPPGPMEEWARRRRQGLGEALASSDPQSLPRCPAWMFEGCPYRDACACGAEPDRSQR